MIKRHFFTVCILLLLTLNQGCMMMGMFSDDGNMMDHTQHDAEAS